MNYRSFKSLVIVLTLAGLAGAQDIASFEKRTTVKKLDNGLTVLICERPEAPVFSFFTQVDAGSVQDPQGQTGLAHMFEHMAFKGTDKIGTTNYAAEKVALEKVEQAYAAYMRERDKPVGRDEQKVKSLQKAWQDAVTEANKYVKPNEFPQIVEINGHRIHGVTDLQDALDADSIKSHLVATVLRAGHERKIVIVPDELPR